MMILDNVGCCQRIMIGIQINKPSEPIGDIRELTSSGENTGNVETRIITIVMVVFEAVKAIPLISACMSYSRSIQICIWNDFVVEFYSRSVSCLDSNMHACSKDDVE